MICKEDWKWEVANGDTILGFKEWKIYKGEIAEDGKKMLVWFVSVDRFNRPIFKDKYHNYYGSTEVLFSREEDESSILTMITESDLTYFGRGFKGECEPMGTLVDNITIVQGGLT